MIDSKKITTEQFNSKYETKETIGNGTFSIVKLGIDLETNEKVAIKILEKKKIINSDDIERVEREIKILQNFNNLNIIKIFDIFQTEENHYFIMEYCENGELFNYIVEKQKLNEKEASYFYYQLINGLEYIHSKNIVHRDLKPENLLLGKGNILKIIDFGLSNFFDGKNLLSTPCGSPCYASPEMVSGNDYNGFFIDVWSTGIILYAMIYGYLPFEDSDNDILFEKIANCDIEYPGLISNNAKNLMERIIVNDPDKRIKIQDIKRHPFYLQGMNVFKYKHPELIIDDENKENIENYERNENMENYEKNDKNDNNEYDEYNNLKSDYVINNRNDNDFEEKENSELKGNESNDFEKNKKENNRENNENEQFEISENNDKNNESNYNNDIGVEIPVSKKEELNEENNIISDMEKKMMNNEKNINNNNNNNNKNNDNNNNNNNNYNINNKEENIKNINDNIKEKEKKTIQYININDNNKNKTGNINKKNIKQYINIDITNSNNYNPSKTIHLYTFNKPSLNVDQNLLSYQRKIQEIKKSLDELAKTNFKFERNKKKSRPYTISPTKYLISNDKKNEYIKINDIFNNDYKYTNKYLSKNYKINTEDDIINKEHNKYKKYHLDTYTNYLSTIPNSNISYRSTRGKSERNYTYIIDEFTRSSRGKNNYKNNLNNNIFQSSLFSYSNYTKPTFSNDYNKLSIYNTFNNDNYTKNKNIFNISNSNKINSNRRNIDIYKPKISFSNNKYYSPISLDKYITKKNYDNNLNKIIDLRRSEYGRNKNKYYFYQNNPIYKNPISKIYSPNFLTTESVRKPYKYNDLLLNNKNSYENNFLKTSLDTLETKPKYHNIFLGSSYNFSFNK